MIINKEQKEQIIDFYKEYKKYNDSFIKVEVEEVKFPNYITDGCYLSAFKFRQRIMVADTVQLAVRFDKDIDKAFALLYIMGVEVGDDD